MGNDDPLFSRNTTPCPWGKCTEEAKTLLPEETKNLMIALATIKGQTISEYMRDMCFERVYGHIAILRARTNNGTAGTGQE